MAGLILISYQKTYLAKINKRKTCLRIEELTKTLSLDEFEELFKLSCEFIANSNAESYYKNKIIFDMNRMLRGIYRSNFTFSFSF